jgi:hypothetical protein
MEASPIREYLNSLPRNERLYYFANPGNAGDALIAHATYQLFIQLGIDYCIVDAGAVGPTLVSRPSTYEPQKSLENGDSMYT